MDNMHDGPTGPQPGAASPEQYPTYLAMRAAKRWLLASPDKVPYYTNGQRRSGVLDGAEDVAQFATYEDARASLGRCGTGWHLGFALGPDGRGGCWQGIDLDKISANRLAEEANAAPGYV